MNCTAAMDGAVCKNFGLLNLSGALILGDADQADHTSGVAVITSVGKKQIAVTN